MTKKKTIILILSAVLVLAAILIIYKIEDNQYFETTLYILFTNNTENVSVEYNGKTIDMGTKGFGSDYAGAISTGFKLHCSESLPKNSKFIRILIPDKIILTIYPRDDSSVFIDVNKVGKFHRKYKLTDTGNFSSHCEKLYQITNDEIFLSK